MSLYFAFNLGCKSQRLLAEEKDSTYTEIQFIYFYFYFYFIFYFLINHSIPSVVC